jgi:hypothetical protein
MFSGEPLPASLQEALASVGGLAANSSFDETIARFVCQKVFPMVKFVREGDLATKGEGSTLFKYIKEGLKMEKASFKNWCVSGWWLEEGKIADQQVEEYHPGCFEAPSN